MKLAVLSTNVYILIVAYVPVKYSPVWLHASATRIVVLRTLKTVTLPRTNTLIAFSAVIFIGDGVNRDFVGI